MQESFDSDPSAVGLLSLIYPIRGYWNFVLFALMVVARQFGDVKHHFHQSTVSCWVAADIQRVRQSTSLASEVLWRTRCMSAATQQETVDWWKWCLTSPNWRATTIKANKTKFQYPLMGYIKLNKPTAEGSESKLSCTRKGGQDEQSRPPKKSLRS